METAQRMKPVLFGCSLQLTVLNSVYSVCSNCKQPPKKREDLKRCSRCQFTRYCSELCQRKDWDFHRFACSVVAKKLITVKA